MPQAALLLAMSVPLQPAQAETAGYYRVRVPSYACTDPRSTALLVERASHHLHLRAFAQKLGGCFRVRPAERWEILSNPDDQLVLMRRVPPHAGEPPLYFQASLVSRPHPYDTGRSVAGAADPAATQAPEADLTAHPTPAPSAVAPGGPPASNTIPTTATRTAPGQDATAPLPARRHHIGLFMLWIGPMLVWAALAGLVAYIIRRALRRPAPQPTVRDALEGAPLSRVRIAERRPRPEPSADPVSAEDEPTPPKQPEMQPPRLLPTPLPTLPSGPTALTLDRPRPTSLGRAESSLRDYRSRCVARLRRAGWDARPPLTTGVGATDVLASNGSLLVALRCHPSNEPVGIEAVEDACLARERHRSDLGAIVSNAPFTPSARELATTTGIMLLREEELASFAA